MPNYFAGEELENGYQYLLTSSIDEIKNFYNKELANLNWKLLSTSINVNEGITLKYSRCTDKLTIEIIPIRTNIVRVRIQVLFWSCY
jgi:hypothetical protein